MSGQLGGSPDGQEGENPEETEANKDERRQDRQDAIGPWIAVCLFFPDHELGGRAFATVAWFISQRGRRCAALRLVAVHEGDRPPDVQRSIQPSRIHVLLRERFPGTTEQTRPRHWR